MPDPYHFFKQNTTKLCATKKSHCDTTPLKLRTEPGVDLRKHQGYGDGNQSLHKPLMKNLQIGRGLIFLSEGSLTSPSSRSSSCKPTKKIAVFKALFKYV